MGGRIPSAVGYQPTLATDMGSMQERITTTKKGSITSVQAIYVPADDLTDPAPATTFAHLDATTMLCRGIAELGISLLFCVRMNCLRRMNSPSPGQGGSCDSCLSQCSVEPAMTTFAMRIVFQEWIKWAGCSVVWWNHN